MMKEMQFEGFAVQAPEHWLDITEAVEGESPPITLAVEDGLGALQFSVAIYKTGPRPNSTSQTLREMLGEFAKGQNLGTPMDIVANESPRPAVTAHFAWDDSYLRVWYASENGNFVFATYTVDKGSAFANELQEAEEIVRSLKFV
jgi:hypothetical protein